MNFESVPKAHKYLIIGAGVFGLSTAWHLLNDGCNDIPILDQPNSLAPSQEVSKFFRLDYTDPERMKLVMRSKVLWEKDDLFKPYLKQTGRVVAYSAAQCGTLDGIDYAHLSWAYLPRSVSPVSSQ